jgi:hypothetical protein
LTVPADTNIGTYDINGTIINADGAVTIVDGDNMISLDLVGYYRRLGNDPNKVENSDLLKAIEDWRKGIAPDGFTSPITEKEVMTLINEWAMG